MLCLDSLIIYICHEVITLIIFWWMEVYPDKIDGKMYRAMQCFPSILSGYNILPLKYYQIDYLSFNSNACKCLSNHLDINLTNSVIKDLLLVSNIRWMKVYPIFFNQSKSRLLVAIKWLNREWYPYVFERLKELSLGRRFEFNCVI